MKISHFTQRTLFDKKIVPFEDTEEAWFWYVRCERARRDGAMTQKADLPESRPCDPDDMYRFVMNLRKRKKLNDNHIQVLAKFGWRDSPPDQRVFHERRSWALWDEAIDCLSTVLKSKGIVRIKDSHDNN